jgi:transposase
MKKSYIIGVDVSKLTLDVHCYGQADSLVIGNDGKGFKVLQKWI